jgi:predicted alpha/beta-fold hydrolase
LPDGDFLDLTWSGPHDGALVMLLHGLEGSMDSHYVTGLMQTLSRCGYRILFVNFRGCSGEPNRLPRSYHSGDTADIHFVVEHLAKAHGQMPFAAVGFSLGGNVLLKWLGEQREAAPVRCAVAVSVPFLLDHAARRLREGLSRIYQRHLIGKLQRKFRAKFALMDCPLKVDIDALNTFHRFDDQITAPLHGFNGVADYYARSSSRQFLGKIRRPTLILHAEDDPFMYPETVPRSEELAPAVQLELSRTGGHVGFIQGVWPFIADYWIDRRVLNWLNLHATPMHGD